MQALRSAVLAIWALRRACGSPARAHLGRLDPIWTGSLDITDKTNVIFISDNGAETFRCTPNRSFHGRPLCCDS